MSVASFRETLLLELINNRPELILARSSGQSVPSLHRTQIRERQSPPCPTQTTNRLLPRCLFAKNLYSHTTFHQPLGSLVVGKDTVAYHVTVSIGVLCARECHTQGTVGMERREKPRALPWHRTIDFHVRVYVGRALVALSMKHGITPQSRFIQGQHGLSKVSSAL